MLSKGQGKTKGSYYTLLNALAEDGRLEEAEELWAMIFSENLENLPREFFSKMISIYYNKGMHEKMFEVESCHLIVLLFNRRTLPTILLLLTCGMHKEVQHHMVHMQINISFEFS